MSKYRLVSGEKEDIITTNTTADIILSTLSYATFVNADDGEVILGRIVTPEEDYANIKAQEQKRGYQKLKESQKIVKEFVGNIGAGEGFYFSKYRDLLKVLNNDYKQAFRFMYLCTYADYDGILRLGNSEKNYMMDKDIAEVMNLSRNTLKEMKEIFYKKGLIFEEDDYIRVDPTYYLKGNMIKDFRQESCRVINKGLQEIYINSKPSEHKTIGKIIPLLDYIHIEYNILCKNTTCKNKGNAEVLSLKEIGEILGSDEKHYKRLLNLIFDIKVGGQPLFAKIELKKDVMRNAFVMNPHVFYKGSNEEGITWLKSIFDML